MLMAMPYTYLWRITEKPAGSSATLSSDSAVQPDFSTDLTGQYIAQLVVNDGIINSEPNNVLINALLPNTLPVADAGVDQTGVISSVITLDGSASSDAGGDSLSYHWSLTNSPQNSHVVLDNAFIVNPSFVIDTAGDYIAQLVVNDGQADSPADAITISTTNSRPLADAGTDQSHLLEQQT